MLDELSRREFGRELAAVAGSAPVISAWPMTGTTTLSAAIVASAVIPTEVAAEEDPPKKAEPEQPDPARVEAAAWLDQIRARYPDPHLTPEILKDIAGDVLGDVMHCRRLNSIPLKNSDAPSFVCFAWSGANHAAQ